ncbi:MAG: acyltransferase [Bacteroidales bacterium]|nr:acyltransferase [Bacteroidales bacterium]
MREKRKKAYTARYGTGPGLDVEYDVNISRQHYLDGTISIGKNVLLAKHVFIDYSGFVTIKDNVQLTNGVIIESHHHPFHSDHHQSRAIAEQTTLVIEEGAVVGSRAIIMPSCHYIGKHSRVGAGAVVTHDVPDFAVVAGVPAKIIRTSEP